MGDAKPSPEASALGVTRFNETGSGSLGWISASGRANTISCDMPLAEFFQTTATITIPRSTHINDRSPKGVAGRW
jgi:hypothetical protein